MKAVFVSEMTCLNGSLLHPASAKVVWLPLTSSIVSLIILCHICQLKTAAGPSLGIDLDNWRLTDMDYADDIIVLFSLSSEDLSSVLRILKPKCGQYPAMHTSYIMSQSTT